MVAIIDLWLPIILSAVAVFFTSSMLHMVLTYHRADYQKLADEDAVLDALAPLDLPPGDYTFPHCVSPSDFQKDGVAEKFNRGPVGMMTVFPKGPPAMGKPLAQWFVFTLVVSGFVAYIATRALPPGADYLAVFQIVGATAFGAYALGGVPNSIWYQRQWGTTLRFVFDGFVFGCLTAGFFAWLWPSALTA